jgi:hypothetical protein
MHKESATAQGSKFSFNSFEFGESVNVMEFQSKDAYSNLGYTKVVNKT